MKNLHTNMVDDLYNNHFSNSSAPVAQQEALWNAIQGRRKSPGKLIVLSLLAIGLLLIGLAVWSFKYPSVKENEKVLIAASTSNDVVKMATSNEHKGKPSSEIQSNSEAHKMKSNLLLLNSTQNQLQENGAKENTQLSALLNVGESSIGGSSKNAVPPVDLHQKVVTENKEILATSDTNANLKNSMQKDSPVRNASYEIAILKAALSPISVPQDHPQLIAPGFRNKNKDWDKCEVKEPGHFFINGYGQASAPLEQITQKEEDTNDAEPTYEEEWDEKINPFISYSTGVQLGYAFSWNGYVSAGLAFQHFQTKYEEQLKVTERITIFDERAYFYIDGNGETVWVADSVTVINIYDKQETYANNHKLWHIPIQFGYTTYRNNLRLGANVEAMLNISKSYQGHFLNENRSITEINSENDKDYMSSSLGVSVSAGLHLGYMLGDHWEVYLNPRFRLNNRSFLHDSQNLKIVRQFAGVRVGMQYNF